MRINIGSLKAPQSRAVTTLAGLALLFATALPWAAERDRPSSVPPQIQRPPDIATERQDRPRHPSLPRPKPIDLNRASTEDLMRLPGIDEALARRIVEGRPYSTKGELLDKGVLSPEHFDAIEDHIVVGSE